MEQQKIISDLKIREALESLAKVNQEINILVSTINVLLADLNAMNQKIQQQLVIADQLKQENAKLKAELEKLKKKEKKEG